MRSKHAGPRDHTPPGAQRGMVMMSILGMLLVLTLFAVLVLSVAGKEMALSYSRLQGAGSMYVSEGGAVAGRSALMAFVNAYPVGVSSIDPTLQASTASQWYANGNNNNQIPFGVFNFIVTDNQQFAMSVGPGTASVPFQVNWGLPYAHLKLQTGGTPANVLGGGSYTSTVVVTPNPTADSSCSPSGSSCAVHLLGPSHYEIFYSYTVTSTGNVPPMARRAVKLSGNFSIQLRLQNFAMYSLFTDTHTSPTGGAVWFTNATTFNGPVHTNGEFRFAQFPTFTDKLQSVSTKAWYYNNGSSVELSGNANVNNGTRIDAPLVPPDPNPQAAAPANFTRGSPSVPIPSGPYNQQGVAIGLNPGNTSQVTTGQLTDGRIPELRGAGSVPNGIYVPVNDAGNVSTAGDQMGGGVYVQGNLDSLTMSLGGGSNNLAVYTFTQGSTTTTVTVDRTNNQTTVNSNAWISPGPASRTFTGVPKGWQGAGGVANASMIYVEGAIKSLSGTLQTNEQTTITASGNITIQGNIQYQTPPDPSDPTSNPINVLGLYSSGGDIVVGASAPNNVTIQATLMAGSTGSSYNSSVNVANYNTGSPRGQVNLLGGVIEKYYGPFGTANSQGTQLTGFGRNFTFDTRMTRGFTPPYFPTTNLFMVTSGSQTLAGVKPTWRETTPP